MHTGKIPETVLKRSVLRKLHKGISAQCQEYYGTDCAYFAAGAEMAYTSVCSVPGFEHCPGKLVLAAANNLYAGGAEPAALMLQALLPVWYEEAALQKDMEAIAAEAAVQGMQILGGHTQAVSAVQEAVYTVTGIGARGESRAVSEKTGSVKEAGGPDAGSGDTCISEASNETGEQMILKEAAGGRRRPLRPGDTLILTKWIALGGTAALALHYEDKLKGRYPFSLIDRAKEFEKLMSVAQEARAINHFGTAAVHDLSQGGVFGALWEMAEHAGVGLEVDLKKIPVRQETVEICEYFDVNPYELYSAGSLLVGVEHGESLVRELARCSIPAAVIGRVTEEKGRVILNGEDRRYLDRPKQDEWYRLAEK